MSGAYYYVILQVVSNADCVGFVVGSGRTVLYVGCTFSLPRC